MAEERNLEETIPSNCSRKGNWCSRMFCLKGLATTYKVLSILVVLYMLYGLVMTWIEVFKVGFKTAFSGGLYVSLQIIVVYGFIALALITVSRILKTLRKIKHAVEHR